MLKNLFQKLSTIKENKSEIIEKIVKQPLENFLEISHEINSKKDKVFTCSIINAKSGKCSENCAFCAQSSHHKVDVPIYKMVSEEEIYERAKYYSGKKATQFSIVTSGYKVNEKELATICNSIKRINRDFPQLSLCASIGNLTFNEMKQLKAAGISRYHHNLETARSYYSEICTTHDYDTDIETIKIAQKAGLKLCVGGIIGLGENWEQRFELAQTIKELKVDNIPLNFLNPIKGTKLENQGLVKVKEALKTIVIFKMINPETNIGICGGREITLRDFQSWIFKAGANGLMFGNYLTTTGRSIEDDIKMIEDLEMKYERI